jgi:small subunit ribosomal protein S18
MRNDIDDNMDRDGDGRGGKGGGRTTTRRKALSSEILAKVDYKSPQVLKSFVTDRGKMIPRRVSGASAGQQRVIIRAVRRARMLALLPFSVSGE